MRKKNKKVSAIRIYAIPFLAALTAGIFWMIYGSKDYYWWIMLIGAATFVYYYAYFSSRKAVREKSRNENLGSSVK